MFPCLMPIPLWWTDLLMKRFFDNWARAYRDSRAVGAAVLLVLMLAWAWYVTRDYASDKIVRTEHVSATVIHVPVAGSSARRAAPVVCMVELEDGRKIRLMFTNPAPKVGDSVPLRVEYFENGEAYYSLDGWIGGM